MIQGKCQGHTMCVLIAHKKILCDSRCHGLSGGVNRETSPAVFSNLSVGVVR